MFGYFRIIRAIYNQGGPHHGPPHGRHGHGHGHGHRHQGHECCDEEEEDEDEGDDKEDPVRHLEATSYLCQTLVKYQIQYAVKAASIVCRRNTLDSEGTNVKRERG